MPVEGRAYLDLRAIAKKSGRANDEYLRLYALEGFLLRLAGSVSSQDFVLKAGVLLAAYQRRRRTADIDFAALNTSNDLETTTSMILGLADKRLPDDHNDGLRFDPSHTHAVAIRDEDQYQGVRITLGAQRSTARMPFHLDVTVGDPIWPQTRDGALSRPTGWKHQPARLGGSKENTNGLLRQYFAKGTDLSVHSPARLLEVATELNPRPGKHQMESRPHKR